MAKYVYIIKYTEGWYDDYDSQSILTEAFIDESDAQNYCDKLCASEIKRRRDWDIEEGDVPVLEQGVWRGNRLTLYQSRDDERFDWKNDPIERDHWEVIRMNLHN